MTELEQRLLSVIQDAFPLEERPYLRLAEMLNAQGTGENAGADASGTFTEQQVFDAIENLRRSGIVRRIGGVYDSKTLGFISRLCAGKVPTIATGASDDSALDKFAAAVNAVPAITHNYVRSHEYNVWFTVIAESEEEIRRIVDGLCASTDLHDVHILSATKKFKINTVMGKGLDERRKTRDERSVFLSEVCNSGLSLRTECNEVKQSPARILSDSDRARISIACTDIPHTLTPFKDWGVSCKELRDDLAQKRMRRFGAVLRHQDAGFAYNAMVCFEVVDGRKLDVECGAVLAQKPYISHCYNRPAFEGFPYTLYAMMHAPSAAELDQYIKDAAASIGNPDYAVLNSVRELKKTSFTFFLHKKYPRVVRVGFKSIDLK
ncbi:MAG: Lrp/AsnC family transcriptional regulator [Fibrobacter sp.]|uniref:Lrp/AsnC family transcriptional regulator n=1 Tax=Fibrobacter sp. TaxID=35828 RepID=UPI001B24B67C|nr:Lrp/AsnC family transcriptional regulator [Fibrobacter sp.]MBO7061697.1 Lrp/AsnC family transcriptional regulator [Fibrobacter sp.]